LLEWLHKNGPDQSHPQCGLARGVDLQRLGGDQQAPKPTQGSLFEEYEL
jgi:hypothetical protein